MTFMNNFIIFIKRKIISSSFFWRFRHFFQSSWLSTYNNKRVPTFYFKLISENNILSILDFGCASGTLLYQLYLSNPGQISYGIDINKEAIKNCYDKFKNSNSKFFFDNKLKPINLFTFLKNNSLTKFDLIVFDRVLYCLSDKDLENLLYSLSKFTNAILIDDFEFTHEHNTSGYKHRDWNFLLSQYNFEIIMNIPIIYSRVMSANARTLFFKRKI